jgi:ADP-ribosyl-[dinitrogen reductase] hydrolase
MMELQNHERDRFHGAVLGLACGDALGSSNQYLEPGSFEPVTDMVGGGPYQLKPGYWTDDTSMALCLGHSLLVSHGFDAHDQMDRYCDWMRTGYQSCTGGCFDISDTALEALQRYQQTRYPFSGSNTCCSAGNGSIMRLAPVVMFYSGHLTSALHYCGESSRTTHGNSKCIDASKLLGLYLYRALNGANKGAVLAPTPEGLLSNVAVDDLATGGYIHKHADMIRGTEYVIDCLEAALWCFWHTDSFSDAVLMAANLGDDADTTAAVCGQLAGAFYGASAIPRSWLDKLAWAEDIRVLGDELYLASHHPEEEISHFSNVVAIEQARK